MKSILVTAIVSVALTSAFFLSRGPSVPKAEDPRALTPESAGVLSHKAGVQPGMNLIHSWTDEDGCSFFDLDGNSVAKLPGQFCEIIPGTGVISASEKELSLFDAQFNTKWRVAAQEVHHDVTVSRERREIFFLDRKVYPGPADMKRLCADVIVGVDYSGNEIFRWDAHREEAKLLAAFKVPVGAMKTYFDKNCDGEYSHANAIEVISKEQEAKIGGAFHAGDLLVTFLRPAVFVVLQRNTGQVSWLYHEPGYSGFAHSARITPEGNIIYFKNNTDDFEGGEPLSHRAELSLIDPRDKKEIWSYRADEEGRFASFIFGHVQPLENGNFLVSDNPDGGHAFEITRDKKIVWEWAYGGHKPDGKRKMIYRVLRVDKNLAEELNFVK